jgi:hypothetical protein
VLIIGLVVSTWMFFKEQQARQQGNSAILNTPNLLGYWRFDPVFHANSCVNGYTGALQGNARIGPPGSGSPLASDPANQALILDGANNYLITGLTGPIVSQGTVLAWVFLTAQPSTAGHFFAVVGQSHSGNDFNLQIQTDDHIYFYTDGGSATVYPQALPLNQWHFLAATFVANSTRNIYLDGQLVASSIAGSHSVNDNPFCIGNDQVFGPRYFKGRIDEVAVFNRALTASEIAAAEKAAELRRSLLRRSRLEFASVGVPWGFELLSANYFAPLAPESRIASQGISAHASKMN